MAEFHWTQKSEEAAELLAEGNLAIGDIADRAGISRQSLWVWRQTPEFAARVEGHRAVIRGSIRDRGIAILEKRVAALNDRWNRLQRVIEERADDPEMRDIPGGKTGLMVRTIKRIVVESDDDDERTTREVAEYAVDTGLLKELREHEKQAAQELGQWTEKRSIEDARKSYDVSNSPDDL